MRNARKGSRRAPAFFGLAVPVLALMPTSVGYQDLGSLIARQPFVIERVREHFIASPFGTIHAATFRFPRPLGTGGSPAGGMMLASLSGTGNSDISAGFDSRRFFGAVETQPKRVFPTVDRSAKGDRLVPAAAPSAVPTMPGDGSATPVQDEEKPPEPAPLYDISLSLELHPQIPVADAPAGAPAEDAEIRQDNAAISGDDGGTPSFGADENPTSLAARIYFSVAPLGGALTEIEPWGPGEQPVLESPYAADPDLKSPGASSGSSAGETIANKGQVNGAVKRSKSPAERLGLSGPSRAKAEKCLSDAVYFEARGESVRGQIAVAQVVMNRVFSGFYPDNVCGVVYQNAHRHLACQFTFACDGIPDRVTEPEAWARAKRIARDTLDGKLWLADVGKATHYHAYWVHPWWVRTMRKLDKIGVHTFYRPRRWGDGSEAPAWGDADMTAAIAKTM